MNRPDFLMPRHQAQLLRAKPYGLSKITLSDEERIFFEKYALDIFTICSNAGFPLRDCLVAIMLTGMDWGINGVKDNQSH